MFALQHLILPKVLSKHKRGGIKKGKKRYQKEKKEVSKRKKGSIKRQKGKYQKTKREVSKDKKKK